MDTSEVSYFDNLIKSNLNKDPALWDVGQLARYMQLEHLPAIAEKVHASSINGNFFLSFSIEDIKEFTGAKSSLEVKRFEYLQTQMRKFSAYLKQKAMSNSSQMDDSWAIAESVAVQPKSNKIEKTQ